MNKNGAIAFLLTGSNLGDRRENLCAAQIGLAEKNYVLLRQSQIYETEAWGKMDQQSFYNQCLQVQCPHTHPQQLLKDILHIEKKLGRIRTEKWGPRILDIDILAFENEIIELATLDVPHPFLSKRKFALIPFYEIAPQWIHPQTGETIELLLLKCSDSLVVKPIAQMACTPLTQK